MKEVDNPKMKSYGIKYEITPADELIDSVSEFILEHYKDDISGNLNPTLETEIDNYFSVFKDELFCLVEYPYVDKLFRNSYYTYYSSKHRHSKRDCIRISFFSTEITKEDFLDPKRQQFLSELFLGTLTIRPTLNAPFGRALIDPSALKNSAFTSCYQSYEASVLGLKLKCNGFPHCSQDTESIKCAETSIWMIMEYFSNKYPEYKPILPSEIHKTLETLSFERQLPSAGLTMEQISYVLKQYGFGTKIYSESQFAEQLYEIIDCYIESGIPILLGLKVIQGEEGHVVICIGKENQVGLILESEKVIWHGNEQTIYSSFSMRSKYVVQDDNLPPYQIIDPTAPGAHYTGELQDNYQIDSVVVPLYPKIYLDVNRAKEMFFGIIGDSLTGYKFSETIVIRRLLASSRSFKEHISNLPMNNDLKTTIVGLKMPKFIWIAEIYNKKTYNGAGSEAIGLVILDATEANQVPTDTLVFAAYPEKYHISNENILLTLKAKFEDYLYYSNLK